MVALRKPPFLELGRGQLVAPFFGYLVIGSSWIPLTQPSQVQDTFQPEQR